MSKVAQVREVTGFALSFAPWIIFSVVTQSPSTWEWGALAALVSAVILTIPWRGGGRSVKVIDAAGVAFFGVLAVLGLFVDAAELNWLERNSQAISSFALAAIAFGSLLVMPFTEQYAREQVEREHWDSPVFKRTNRVLTVLWGATFAAAGICGIIQQYVSGSAVDLFNWIIPVALIVGAMKFTEYYSEAQGRRAEVQAAEGSGSEAGTGPAS